MILTAWVSDMKKSSRIGNRNAALRSEMLRFVDSFITPSLFINFLGSA